MAWLVIRCGLATSKERRVAPLREILSLHRRLIITISLWHQPEDPWEAMPHE